MCYFMLDSQVSFVSSRPLCTVHTLRFELMAKDDHSGLGACKTDNCFEQLSSVEPPEVGTDDLSFASPVEVEAEEDIQVALEEGEGTCCLCGSSFEDSGLEGWPGHSKCRRYSRRSF